MRRSARCPARAARSYLHDLDAQRRIRATIPEAKLIAVLRDPADRAHSSWALLWSAGLEPYANFLAACDQEEQRVAGGWAPFWQYTGLGRYGEQLEHLYGLFAREQVLVLRYRNLRDDPVTTLDTICEFLGVETGHLERVPSENVRPHVPASTLNAGLQSVLRGGAAVGHVFPLPVRKSAREPLLALLRRGGTRRPKMTPDEGARLTKVFADGVPLLERLTGESFAEWLTTDYNTDS
jgi:hypothetical protein